MEVRKMESTIPRPNHVRWQLSPIDSPNAFSRLDETDDKIFYATDRFVGHIDVVATETVEQIIGTLINEANPVILDLMAGWDSHIPHTLHPSEVIGLGLNENEISRNRVLTDFVVHDLNENPSLPFPDNMFDAVLNTVSVDYMTKPVEVFLEVGRILKPGGLFLVTFSNRMFPQKVVKVWKEADEEARVILVEEFFERTGMFEKPSVFVSKGKPRPKDDKYAHLNIPSDPIYAVYADKMGRDTSKAPRPPIALSFGERLDKADLDERKRRVKDTLLCPYCAEKLTKWAVPDNPFSQTWDNDHMYICFNDACPYYVRGWDCMRNGVGCSGSYRLMYNPDKDTCTPIPVHSPKSLRDGIIEE
jgi:SAM-dependent methyltransferase